MIKSYLNIRNINYGSFVIYFIGMYCGLPFSVNAIALFILIQIGLLIKQGISLNNTYTKFLILPILFYLIHILSILYSSNKTEIYFDLEVKFSFLIIPILFALKKKEQQADIHILANIYVFIGGIMSLAYLTKGLFLYSIHNIYPTYMIFSEPMHPSYLSLYLVTNILFILYLFIGNKAYTIINFTSLFLSLLVLYFSESKAGMISLVLLLIFVLFKLFYHKSKGISIGIILISLIAFISIFTINERFKALLNAGLNFEKVFAHPEKVQESTALRMLAWDASIRIIKKHPIIGVGGGDIKDELSKIYKTRDYKKPLEMHMNAHNQYLETTVGEGVIGLLFLLAMLIILFFNRTNMLLSQGFSLIFSINILFESMFNVQAGVVFFVIMYSILFTAQNPQSPSIYEKTI